jgi:hypothetical protein
MRRFPPWIQETFEFLWQFGTPDEATFLVLDEALHSADSNDLLAVLKILIAFGGGVSLPPVIVGSPVRGFSANMHHSGIIGRKCNAHSCAGSLSAPAFPG